MNRTRMSTTVNTSLLDAARALEPTRRDAQLLDDALGALLRVNRKAEIDATIAAGYERFPLDTPDEWGDLKSWGEAKDGSGKG